MAAPLTEVVAGLMMLLVAAVFYLAAGDIAVYPRDRGLGPRAVPQALCVMIAGLGALLVLSGVLAWRRRGSGLAFADVKPFVVWVVPLALLSFAYVPLVRQVEYLLPTIAITAVVMAMFGNRGWLWLGVAPVATGLVFYWVFFVLLRLYLPAGQLISFP